MDQLSNTQLMKMLSDNQKRLETNAEKQEATLGKVNVTLNELVTHMKLTNVYYDDFREFRTSVKADIDFLKKPKDSNCGFGKLINERVHQNKTDIDEIKSQATWFNRLFIGGFISSGIAFIFFMARA